MRKFFVSVVLTSPIPSGTSIVNNTAIFEAENKSDAIGQAIIRAMDMSKGHSVALPPSAMECPKIEEPEEVGG